MSGLEAVLRGKVVKLNPQHRTATIALPAVGAGRSFRTDYALGDEGLASVRELTGAARRGPTVGAVTAVRPREGGAELDLKVNSDSAWSRLADRNVRVDARVTFDGMSGADPHGGRVERVDID